MLNPRQNMKHLSALARDKSLPAATRLTTIAAFNRANPKAGYPLLSALIGGMKEGDRKAAVDRISFSTQGGGALVKLLSEKVISVDDFNYLAATRVAASLRKNPTATRLMKVWTDRKSAEDAALARKVDQYAEAAMKLEGNPAVGQGMFQMCLACHAVGTQGYSIAPALDGSASRETHALLTAIMRPDVAVEGGYELYRVIRKDGTMVEGYLYSSDSIGVTVATIGNNKIFIPRGDIRTQGGVRGKSFMVAMLNHMPQQNMIDLLSYIQTLK